MALTQDYGKVWGTYAKRFKGGTLGEEWGTPERDAAIFKAHIEPHVGAESVAAELGVGGGKFTVMVAPKVSKLYGIDISREMLDLAASKAEFLPVQTDGKRVAIPDDSIDFFFSFDSMVHIFPNDLYRYIEEISRFLKPQGKAVFEFADWDSKGMMQKFLKDQEVYSRTGTLSPGAFGFISRAAITEMAKHVGLACESLQPLTGRTSVITLTR